MKLQKCWLSASLCASLIATILAQEQASNKGAGTVAELNAIDIAALTSGKAKVQKHQFSAEVPRLLMTIANNVYTDRQAVIRELITNSIDAMKKQHARKLSQALDSTEELDSIDKYKVVVTVDKESRLLAITDNGIGMTRKELEECLGTIAKSGTAEFNAKEAEKFKKSTDLVGQFGIGFYSSLLVADRITVISKSDSDDKTGIWEMDSTASFDTAESPNLPGLERGTRVILHLKKDAEEFLDHAKLESIMKTHFETETYHVALVKPKTITEEVPVTEDEEASKETEKEKSEDKKEEAEGDKIKVEDEAEGEKKDEAPKTKKVEKTIFEEVRISQNAKPIWNRSPSEVQVEEYEAAYKQLTGDKYGKPIAYTHFSGETAKSESFRAILYIPERPPFQPFSSQDHQAEIKLHVRGAFVTAKLQDFIPKYLSFVKGIIDSDDISLNISREIIQNTAELRGIKKKVVKKVIEMMTNLQNDKEKFKKFYSSYSSFIKMEISERDDYRDLLAKLLRFHTTKSGKEMVSLSEYIEAMPEGQKSKKVIYYLAGQADEVSKSPFLAPLTAKNIDVILMSEPVDEHCMQRLDKFEDYKFVNVAKDSSNHLDEEDQKLAKEYEEKYKTAKGWISKVLKSSVEKVVLAPGPSEVPGALKSSEFGWTGNMERLIMAQSSVKDDPMLSFFSKQKKILELNPKNPLIHEILERANGDKVDAELKSIVRTLTDAMMVWSGYAVRDTSLFAKNIERMTRKSLNLPVEELKSEEEDDNTKNKAVNLSDLEDDISLGGSLEDQLDEVMKKDKTENASKGETLQSGESKEGNTKETLEDKKDDEKVQEKEDL